MATSKLKAIKSTLKKAIDYIIDPEKTDGGLLVYSHGCSVPTADREMELTAKQGTGRGDRLAYHLIQSFAPDDDITPKKALQLGIEYARKVTGGKYEFVVSTHIDKDHIHNHIIFNAVDYVNHRKYHSDTKDKYRIRDINDEICEANNLSVLPKYVPRRKSKYVNKYKKDDAWKWKLKAAIDQAISKAESFEEFLFIMEMEGYESKTDCKYISFRAPGQERATRIKTIGDNYTEEAIRARIATREQEPVSDAHPKTTEAKTERHPQNQKQGSKQRKAFSSKRINLLVDISKNIKAQQSKAYEHALVRSNINTLVKTMNFLIEHKITTSEDFQIYADGKNAEYSLYRNDVMILENEMLELSEKIKFTQNYKKNASVFYESKRAANPAAFAREHEDQIVLFKASQMYFKRKQLNPKGLDLTEMFERYKSLKAEKESLVKKQNFLKKEIRELEIVAENIDQSIGTNMMENADRREKTPGKEKEQEKQ